MTAGGQKTVLVVDDSPSMRQMLRCSLEEAGYVVVEAQDAVAALARLDVGMPLACALLDVNMPGMNGVDLVREIRARKQHEDLPILMLTRDGKAQRRADALTAGATGYLLKPFVPEQLIGALRMVGV